MALKIMIQGTMSGVGKSLITTGLCRIFRNMGYSVSPFKAQNMALNSYITVEGLEIGRSQALQAMAAGIEPSYRMNPILLKPTSSRKCQVVLRGRVFGDYEYYRPYVDREYILAIIKEELEYLDRNFEIVVIEGAGSPTEINIKERDFANMVVAKLAGSPVLIVGDIYRGGVFASLLGTYLLLEDEEKKLVEGFIINKFIGNPSILNRGIRQLKEMTGVDTLGVVPYLDIRLEEEDTVSSIFSGKIKSGSIEVAILVHPHISNYTDIEPLFFVPDLGLRFVKYGGEIGECDILIIPGTKNTIDDLVKLKESGTIDEIRYLREKGTIIMGLCGGFQMLGRNVSDPYGVESELGYIEGIGLLDVETVIMREKITARTKAIINENLPDSLSDLRGIVVEGYEIHKGVSRLGKDVIPFSYIFERNLSLNERFISDGGVSEDGLVIGTYLHGIFENSEFLQRLINLVRRRKGLHPIERIEGYREIRDREIDKLAEVIKESCDIDRILKIMEIYA